MEPNRTPIFFLMVALVFPLFFVPLKSQAQSQAIDELKAKINERNTIIEALRKEISIYQTQISETGKAITTLQSTIKVLDTTGKKLVVELSVTENKIAAALLTIEKLSLEIDDKKRRLKINELGLAEMIQNMRKRDTSSFIEVMLTYANLSLLWSDSDRGDALNARIQTRIAELGYAKTNLEVIRREAERAEKELARLKQELGDKKKAVDYNQKQKTTLLGDTKNKEQNFKNILKEKMRREEEFEREIFEFESQLKFELNRSEVPARGSGILSWPLDIPVVTQYFGATADARRLYVSGTHNGIDLRASNGTPIKASLSGKVEAVGNTDTVLKCYSYGKWILITHGNGLSTLYAHLSVVSISPGESVVTGQVIGYSGATGYATGPHLHLSVYASAGVSVQKYTQGKFCKNAVMPVAGREAYLDPMEYLIKK